MKAGTLTLLIALCLPISVSATTLRLSSEVDLLVLDGKRSPALSCAVRTVLNSKMVHISWYFVSKNNSDARSRRTPLHLTTSGRQF